MDSATMPALPLIGKGHDRLDGRLKVTGTAPYAADARLPGAAHAVLVTSTIGLGRVARFELDAARAVSGVLLVTTHESVAPGELHEVAFFTDGGPGSQSWHPLLGDRVRHHGEIVAMVVAETAEAAQEAAALVRPVYEAEEPAAAIDSPGVEIRPAGDLVKSHEDVEKGDVERALREADIMVEATYATPAQHHNALELYATVAAWEGDALTIHEPSQWVYGMKNGLARQLGIDPEKVHVVSPFVGGAFGSKAMLTPRTSLVALAARQLGRPVRLVVSRAQGFTTANFRAETRHEVRLGARKDGTLTAYAHTGHELTSRADAFIVSGVDTTARMYACPNIKGEVKAVRADRQTPGFMRSPPEVPYMFALESAMDELAWALSMDPVALRLKNDTDTDPVTGKPFTTRSLAQCWRRGAELFGWEGWKPEVGQMRDGDELVGWGCATATYPTQLSPAAARVTLRPDGRLLVETAAHDVGTGAYTAIGQIAATLLSVPMDMVEVRLGDTGLPPGPVAGGSVTTASVGAAVERACAAVREELARLAVTRNDGPLAGRPADTIRLEEGRLVADGAPEGELLSAVLARAGSSGFERHAEWAPPGTGDDAVQGLYKGAVKIIGGPMKDHSQFAFGAGFVEVRVNIRTRTIRIPRMVGVFAAGRIVNAKTARSQLLGGMVWGMSSALHEASELDRRDGRYVNDNLAEYLVPVHADIGDITIEMLEEDERTASPTGVKGLGELGNVGTNAAVASAVHHATGIRIRELPIRIEKLLPIA